MLGIKCLHFSKSEESSYQFRTLAQMPNVYEWGSDVWLRNVISSAVGGHESFTFGDGSMLGCLIHDILLKIYRIHPNGFGKHSIKVLWKDDQRAYFIHWWSERSMDSMNVKNECLCGVCASKWPYILISFNSNDFISWGIV